MQLQDQKLFRQQCYIDGQWVDAADGGNARRSPTPPPASVLGTVPSMGAAETRAARSRPPTRPCRPGAPRPPRSARQILRRWFELMMANQDDLARLMTAEQGKPLAEARARSPTRASFIEWFAEEGKRVYGDMIPAPSAATSASSCSSSRSASCAAITPWNFPAAMITRKAGAGAGRRLHDGAQAGRARRPIRRWRWPSWPSAPACRPACFNVRHRRRRRDRRRADRATRSCASSPSPARPRSASC